MNASKKTTRKNKKKSSKINIMQPSRYRFEDIFNVYLTSGIIIPRYNVIINGAVANAGQSITRQTTFNGLNLFNYIGREFAGIWNPTTTYLTISGFY